MKKAIAISLILFSMVSAISLQAITPTEDSTRKETMINNTGEKLKKQINRHMFYPIFAQQEMHGTVEVSFMINEEGTVKVLNIQSTNPDLVDYVLKKLKKIKLAEDDESVGKTIKYRFVFKKQA
jgi:hypothetical protein